MNKKIEEYGTFRVKPKDFWIEDTTIKSEHGVPCHEITDVPQSDGYIHVREVLSNDPRDKALEAIGYWLSDLHPSKLPCCFPMDLLKEALDTIESQKRKQNE